MIGRLHSGGSEGSEDSKRPNFGPPAHSTLVIRVWREPGSPEPFRSRIIAESAEGDDPTVSYAHGREAVVAAVNRWLCNFPDV